METQRNLLELPLEVIEEILLWCCKSSLLNLTLVCKDLNEIISNNTRIMENLSLHFSREKMSYFEPFERTRNYSHIVLHSPHPQQARIFRDNRHNLTNLELKKIGVELESMRKVFFRFPNLKHLKIEHIRLRNASIDIMDKPLPPLTLDSLYLNCDKKVLFFLMNSQTKKLSVNSTITMIDEMVALRKFLERQTLLKDFMTCGMHADYAIFAGTGLNKVQFRLEKLTLKNCKEIAIPNFKVFLDNHRETLKEVNITNLANKSVFCDDILSHLSTFENLKRLVLTSVDPSFKPMPFVEELLFLRVRDYENLKWSNKFLNVKRLIISCDDSEKLKEVSNLKELESLVIIHARSLPSLDIPTKLRKIHTIRKPITEIKYFGQENEKLKGLLMEVNNLSYFIRERFREIQRSIEQIEPEE